MRWDLLHGRWGRVYEEIVGHVVAMLLVLSGFYLVEAWVHYLWGNSRLLFGVVPWTWLIDAADVFTFVAFVASGIRMSIKAYNGDL
jgi:hypothetical protein